MSLVLDGTNGLSDVDGSAATPAIRGSDANTGIFFPAADTIAFAEGGVESMRLDSAGNVGIGTSSPDFQLQVEKPAASTFISVVSGTSNTAGIILGDTDSATVGRVEYDNAGNFMSLYTNGSERARIDSSGNLLVGQSSSTAGQVQITNNSTRLISNANGIYRVFTQRLEKTPSTTTHTCAITFGSQGSQWASHIVEVLFAASQGDATGGTGGRATYLLSSLTSVSVSSEIQDIGNGASFSATASGSVVTITATTTSNRDVVAWTVKVTSTFSGAAPTSISIA